VRPGDPAYQAAAVAEAAHWADPATISFADAWARAPLGPLKRYYNRRFTGSEVRTWYEIIAERGPYSRGLILGCGGLLEEEGIVDANPGVDWTIADIDPASLQQHAERFGLRHPGRIHTRQLDFNFAELDPDAYDLIVSVATLHHVVNLEHIAGQINRALTPDGRFYLRDYTGPAGFRFPEAQRRVFEVLYERERARRPDAKLPPVAWRNVDDGSYSPFEAVRSGDISKVLACHLREEWRTAVGAVTGLLLFAGIAEQYDLPRRQPPGRFDHFFRAFRRRPAPVAGWRLVWEEMLSPECLADLVLTDEVITGAGIFAPTNTFAVYTKR
jgi:SAM-dependent methyltransferase